MKKIIQVISFLFSPYSPIITLVLGFLINVITSTASENRPKFIEDLYSAESINRILFYIGVWFVISFAYTVTQNRFKEYENEIIVLNEKLLNKERQIENNSGIIYNKYGELARFNKKQKFYEVLKSFVDNNPIIQTAQIYKYSQKVNNKRKNIEIKVEFDEGYAYEHTEINCIFQSYFTVSKIIYYELISIIDIWRTLGNENFESEDVIECLYSSLENKIDSLVGKIKRKLSMLKDVDRCNDYYAALYRILLLLIDLSYNDYSSGRIIDNILENEEIENSLISIKRTGILNSILLQDTYTFKHVGTSSKNGRIYTSLYFNLYKQNYILLLTLPPNQLDSNWKKQLEDLENEFEDRISSAFK